MKIEVKTKTLHARFSMLGMNRWNNLLFQTLRYEQKILFKIIFLGLLQATKIKINHNVTTPNQIIDHKRCMAIIQMSSY